MMHAMATQWQNAIIPQLDVQTSTLIILLFIYCGVKDLPCGSAVRVAKA